MGHERHFGVNVGALRTPVPMGPRIVGELYGFKQALAALTPAIVNAFVRAFAGADRIEGLEDLLVAASRAFDRSTVRFERAQAAGVWLLYGTMVETCKVLRELRRHGIGKRLKNSEARTAWAGLLCIAHRTTIGLPRKVRNKVSFHFDPTLTRRGIEALSSDQKPVELFQVDDVPGDPNGAFRTTIGLGALMAGMELSVRELDAFISQTKQDHTGLSEKLERVLADLLKGTGATLATTKFPLTAIDWKEFTRKE